MEAHLARWSWACVVAVCVWWGMSVGAGERASAQSPRATSRATSRPARTKPSRDARSRALRQLAHARKQATVILKAHCGRCHIPSLPTARPKALAVFNLTRVDWWRTMNEQKLATSGDMILHSGFSKQIKAQYKRFLRLELRERRRVKEKRH